MFGPLWGAHDADDDGDDDAGKYDAAGDDVDDDDDKDEADDDSDTDNYCLQNCPLRSNRGGKTSRWLNEPCGGARGMAM